MAHKQVAFRAAARAKVLEGATALADLLRITLRSEEQRLNSSHT